VPLKITANVDQRSVRPLVDIARRWVWITTSRPGEQPTRIEVVLLAAFRNGRIHRIWETTWPSWRNVAALEDY
jgi:hypothetical protein